MTLKEIYQAAIDGKKIRMRSWHPGAYVYLKDTHFVAEDESTQSTPYSFLEYYLWEIYEEPEDLDNKIKHATRELGFHIATDMHLSIVKDLVDIIDLKIKQAKL